MRCTKKNVDQFQPRPFADVRFSRLLKSGRLHATNHSICQARRKMLLDMLRLSPWEHVGSVLKAYVCLPDVWTGWCLFFFPCPTFLPGAGVAVGTQASECGCWCAA